MPSVQTTGEQQIPADAQKAAEFRSEVSSAIIKANQLQVQTPEQAKDAADLLKAIVSTKKNMEAKRKQYTAPLLESKKAIDDDFKKMSEPLANAEAAIKKKIGAFHDEEERRLAAERAKAFEEERKRQEEELRKQAANEMQTASESEKEQKEQEIQQMAASSAQVAQNAAATEQDKIKGSTGTASVSKHWTYEVVDEAKIPRAFLVVDSAAIRRAVSAGEREIPGLRIFQETRVSSR